MFMVMMIGDGEDRHGIIVKMMESMMVREIMKMLRKHCRVGVCA